MEQGCTSTSLTSRRGPSASSGAQGGRPRGGGLLPGTRAPVRAGRSLPTAPRPESLTGLHCRPAGGSSHTWRASTAPRLNWITGRWPSCAGSPRRGAVPGRKAGGSTTRTRLLFGGLGVDKGAGPRGCILPRGVFWRADVRSAEPQPVTFTGLLRDVYAVVGTYYGRPLDGAWGRCWVRWPTPRTWLRPSARPPPSRSARRRHLGSQIGSGGSRRVLARPSVLDWQKPSAAARRVNRRHAVIRLIQRTEARSRPSPRLGGPSQRADRP